MKVGVASKLMIGSSLLAPTQSGTFNFRRLSSINCVLSTGGLANVIFGTPPSDILKSCIQLFQHVSLFFKTIKIDITSTNSQEKIDFQGNVLSEPGGENDFARYKPRLRVSRLRGVVIVIIWAKSMAWGGQVNAHDFNKTAPCLPHLPIPGHHRVISGARSANSSTHSLYKDFRQTILCFKKRKKRGILCLIALAFWKMCSFKKHFLPS